MTSRISLSHNGLRLSQNNTHEQVNLNDGTQPIEAQVGAQASEPQDETDFRNTILKVFIDKEVGALKMSLSADNLQKVRDGRKDVKQYITQAMLSCRTADDQLLCCLGPGPIVQASDPDPARIRPDTVLTETYVEPGLSPGPNVQASGADPDPAGIRPDTVFTETEVEPGLSCY